MITPVQGGIRDEYDGILQFSRPSVAYDAQGRRYGPGQMRFEPGKHGMAVRVEEGTVNLLSPTQCAFTGGWEAKGEAQVTITPGVLDPFGGRHAVRIRSVGGTTDIKYQAGNLGTFPAGTAFTVSMWVQTHRPVTIQNTNYPLSTIDTSGAWLPFVKTNTSGGFVAPNLKFIAISAEEDLDLCVYLPQFEAKPYPTTFVVGERKPELLTIPTSVPDSVNPTNLLTENQSSVENNTSDLAITAAGTTLAVSTDSAWHGGKSLRCVCSGSSANQGARTLSFPVLPGRSYTAYVWARGAGNVRIQLKELDSTGSSIGTTDGVVTALNDTWQKLSVQKAFGATGVQAQIACMTSGAQAVTFYLDGMYAGVGEQDWCLGGHRRLLGPSEGTIEQWIYVDPAVHLVSAGYMFGGSTSDSGWKNALILGRKVDGGTTWYSESIDASGAKSSANLGDLAPGWHHIAITWDRVTGYFACYVDGVQKSNIASAKLPSRLFTPWLVGAGGTSSQGYQLNSLIDDLRFSSIARTAQEIEDLYNSGLPAPYDEHTTYLWRADGPSAQRVARAVML